MIMSQDGALPCESIAVEAMKRGLRDFMVTVQVRASSLWRAMTGAVTQTELRERLALSLRDVTAANIALGQEVATREATEAELLTAKKAAERANLAKTRFVAMMTHGCARRSTTFLATLSYYASRGISLPDAVRLALEETLDVILMDVRMPEIDGRPDASGRCRAFAARCRSLR